MSSFVFDYVASFVLVGVLVLDPYMKATQSREFDDEEENCNEGTRAIPSQADFFLCALKLWNTNDPYYEQCARLDRVSRLSAIPIAKSWFQTPLVFLRPTRSSSREMHRGRMTI